MILILDNYDSFTYNLVQYVGALEPKVKVIRNDTLTVKEVLALRPERIIISPGPCTPNEAGISVELIQKTPPTIPLLGVCLGHQSIGQAFGGKVIRAPYLMHGKTSSISHAGNTLFQGIPAPFTATRYHSLIVEKESLPAILHITAETNDGIIMGLRHAERPVFGLQFHPESILTDVGPQLIQNFLHQKGA